MAGAPLLAHRSAAHRPPNVCRPPATPAAPVSHTGVREGTNPVRRGFVRRRTVSGHGRGRPPMASASYYRDQARLLLSWARDTSDRKIAERLRARARDLL